MLTTNKTLYILVILIICACSQTPENGLGKTETMFPLDTANIAEISLDVFYNGSDSIGHENIYWLNNAAYLNIISNLNSSNKITDPKVDLNVEITVVYSDNKMVKILSNNKYFTLDNKIFYSWVDTTFINNYVNKISSMKQCVK